MSVCAHCIHTCVVRCEALTDRSERLEVIVDGDPEHCQAAMPRQLKVYRVHITAKQYVLERETDGGVVDDRDVGVA